MKKIKWIALLLCCVMLIALAGCAFQPTSKSPFGRIEGASYYNGCFGLSCTLDDSWYIYTEEERAEMAGYTADLLAETNKEDLMDSDGATIFDFYAQKEAATINVALASQKNLSFNFLSEQDIIDTTLPQLEEGFSALGIEELSVTSTSLDFIGEEHPCIVLTGIYSGVQMYLTQFCFTSGSYFATVAITAFDEAAVREILSCFSAYEGE